MRILGIDTSLRCSGLGVIDVEGTKMKALDFGLIKNPASMRHSECLRRIHGGVAEFISNYEPDAIAIEGIFFCKNVRTALTLGQARGAVMTACGELPVYEYAPRRVKQAVTGSGRAHKQQVSHMVVSLLNLDSIPPEDAADALAIAMTHAGAVQRPELSSDDQL